MTCQNLGKVRKSDLDIGLYLEYKKEKKGPYISSF